MIQNFCLWIAASVTDATTVNSNGIKTLLPNGLGKVFGKVNTVFSYGPKSLPKNLPDCPIYATDSLIILLQLRNYLQKNNQALKLVH